MTFHHFEERHSVMLEEGCLAPSARCVACNDNFSGPAYTCSQCSKYGKFHLHKSCAELPMILRNPYHPQSLTLDMTNWILRRNEVFKCDCCLKYRGGSFFRCTECNLRLDVKCALITPTINEGQDQLKHGTHMHPLVAIEKKHYGDDNDNHDCCCRICGLCISGAVYGCDPCNFYLHQSCAVMQFPPTLQHFYHPCLLSLCLKIDKFNCHACGKNSKVPYYHCRGCNFRIEIICALLPAKMESEGQQQIHHFSHGHPLKNIMIDLKRDDEIICSACQKHCSGQTYVCCGSDCKFSLHCSCFDLPQKIHHPYHFHPLTLYSLIQRQWHKPEPICRVCYHFSSGFTYSCDTCELDQFDMDVECPVMISNIKYQGHSHNILFLDSMGPCLRKIVQDGINIDIMEEFKQVYLKEEDVTICRACDKHCKAALPLFRCVFCSFFLHLECGPLPLTIQHDSHMDPLTLTESPAVIEGEDKLDTDVFYCDTCEGERDPRLPVYYCSDGSAYLAEIKCVTSEVMLALKGDLGEVELRSAVWHKAGKVIGKGVIKGAKLEEAGQVSETGSSREAGKVGSINMSFHRFTKQERVTKEEREEYSSVVDDVRDRKDWYINGSQSTDRTGLFSDEAYTQFMKSLDILPGGTISVWQRYENLIKVNDHFVTWDLAPIFEDLYAKYGDISADSTLRNPKVKMYFTTMLCGTVRSMCTTRVADLSKDLLSHWWENLKALQIAGFKVQFLFDRLQRVAHAYYGIQVKESKKLKEIDKKIKNVSEDIEVLRAKLEAETAKLEALIEEHMIAESETTEAGSSSMEK